MHPKYNKVHNKFKLNGHSYNHDELCDAAYSLVKEGEPFEKEIGDFLLNWLDANGTIEATTSGSTGAVKKILLKKQNMVNSAISTGNYFGLRPGNTALLCLPVRYIAGKMMLIRAIILGLELEIVQPIIQVFIDPNKKYDFCAMLPIQLSKVVNEVKDFKQIIIGGAPVPLSLLESLQEINTPIFETFGMTETITHVAIKQLNNFNDQNERSQSVFEVLPEVMISQDDRNCLIIDAPHLNSEKIITNDIVKLQSKTEFDWLGRYDNIINSGGLKLFPEQIEKKISLYLKSPFFVTSMDDEELGEVVTLVVEASSNEVDKTIFRDLNKHEIPKYVYALPKFVTTKSGKLQRRKTLQLLD
jgi:O-succinylbenzoic acid--CoA ligase